MQSTPVNSITIPPQFVRIARDYYAGMNDRLYAVCSTGGLTTGTIRPRFGDDRRRASDEEWYWMLWDELADDVESAGDSCASLYEADHNGYTDQELEDDHALLTEFAVYARRWADRLRDEYAIED